MGYYYCVADSPRCGHAEMSLERNIERAWSAPGLVAITGDPKVSQMYVFASSELRFDRSDFAEQRRMVVERFSTLSGQVSAMLVELYNLPNFYLDSLSKVQMNGRFTTGRVALVGDSGYGNTLGGTGTGLAVVGAYILAGELAVAARNHVVAFARYDEIMVRYTKIAGNRNAGRFLAPKTPWGIRARNWFLGSWAFGLMLKYADKAVNNIELRNYPAAVGL